MHDLDCWLCTNFAFESFILLKCQIKALLFRYCWRLDLRDYQSVRSARSQSTVIVTRKDSYIVSHTAAGEIRPYFFISG